MYSWGQVASILLTCKDIMENNFIDESFQLSGALQYKIVHRRNEVNEPLFLFLKRTAILKDYFG